MKFATFGRIAVTALLIAAPLGVASAADMAVKAPKAPPPPAYSWTGFYIGVNGGGAQGNTTWQYYFFRARPRAARHSPIMTSVAAWPVALLGSIGRLPAPSGW